MKKFPEGFLWGSALSGPQTEGYSLKEGNLLLHGITGLKKILKNLMKTKDRKQLLIFTKIT